MNRIIQMNRENIIQYLEENGYSQYRGVEFSPFWVALKKRKEIQAPEFILDAIGRILAYRLDYIVFVEEASFSDSPHLSTIEGSSSDLYMRINNFDKMLTLKKIDSREYFSKTKNLKEYITYILTEMPEGFYSEIRGIFYKGYEHED